MTRILFSLVIFLFTVKSFASDPEIIEVKAELASVQKYNISVTVKHADTGWDHYANAWRVYSLEGELLGERVLHHPHVNEQPFTRNLLGVHIPAEFSEVLIKAVCSETGENKTAYTVKLRR